METGDRNMRNENQVQSDSEENNSASMRFVLKPIESNILQRMHSYVSGIFRWSRSCKIHSDGPSSPMSPSTFGEAND